jgi:Family 4 glycosyl hydrolase
MPTITILGAGSAVFARQLMTDILQIEGLDEGCFALVDIDAYRLKLKNPYRCFPVGSYSDLVFFPHKETHFSACPLPFTTSLPILWESHGQM